jgi:hypothetical protein
MHLVENSSVCWKSSKNFWHWSVIIFMVFFVSIGYVGYRNLYKSGVITISLSIMLMISALLGLVAWGLLSLGMSLKSTEVDDKQMEKSKM